MSDSNAMEQAAGQVGQTAAVALQVLVMAAQALRENQRREAIHVAAPTVPPVAAPVPKPAPDPERDRFAQMIRNTVQPPAVANAIVASPQWPQLAEELQKLETSGVDPEQFLRDAAPVLARMDTDLRAGSPTPGVTVPAAATTPRDPWGPEREGLSPGERIASVIKKAVQALKEMWQKLTGRAPVSALGDRREALARLGIEPQENARLVIAAREALADEHVLASLVTSREWPGIAGQMKQLQEAGRNPSEALAGIPVRIRQAADAGITLTAPEAARGLLTDQAKSPAPAPTTKTTATTPAQAETPAAAPVPTAPAKTKGTVETMGTASPAGLRARAATAKSTTTTPGASPTPGPETARTPTATTTTTRAQRR